MHVLFLSRFPPEIDGVGDYTFELVQYIKVLCKVSVLSIGKGQVDEINGIKIFRFINENKKSHYTDIVSLIKIIDPDIVHFQSATFTFKIPFLFFPLFINKPLIITSHDAPSLRQIHYFPFFNYIYKKSRKIITLSKSIAEIIKKYHFIEDSKIILMHHGADVIKFNPNVSKKDFLEKYGLDSNYFIIMSFGFIGKGKGHHVLIHAYSKVADKMPDTKLIIAGMVKEKENIMYYNYLKYLVKKYGLETRVIFTGYVPSEILPSCIASADIFVLPYLGGLHKSGPLHRALACGRAIIASNIPSFREVIKNYINGILVEPNNVKDLANSLLNLYKDEKLREKISKEARKFAEEHLDWRKIANETYKIYKNLD